MGFGDALEKESMKKLTDNGREAFSRTGSRLVDLFGRAGSMRGVSEKEKASLFDMAYAENAEAAMRLLFYIRDIRGGYGERDTFRTMLKHIANVNPKAVERNLWAVLEFGRADDLYALIGTKAEEDMWVFMQKQFRLDVENMRAGKSISLLVKWIANANSKQPRTRELGLKTAYHLGYDKRHIAEYRKLTASMRRYLDLPEVKMADNRWDEIEYAKCASQCIIKYRRAMSKHSPERWTEYIEGVKSGAKKMNVGTLTPCDIVRRLRVDSSMDEREELEVMWNNLADIVDGNVLVVCDTSGSMYSGSGSVPPYIVAFSLALYFAERNKGDLKNKFITFSRIPEVVSICGTTLYDKIHNIFKANWGQNTDLDAVFRLVLEICVHNDIKQEEMPKSILVISDMEIDRADGSYTSSAGLPFYEEVKRMYEGAGYKLPNLTFWNVNAENSTFLVDCNTDNVTLVSGYSVNVFRNIMRAIETSPYEMVMDVVNSERYSEIKL